MAVRPLRPRPRERPRLQPADLDLQLADHDETALFGWFLACFLAGKRIRQCVALRAWAVLYHDHGCRTAAQLGTCSHGQLVRWLGEGGYRRYDQSTATLLLQLCDRLAQEYGGGILAVRAASSDRAGFERRLLAFGGVGPVTLRIFMEAAAPVLFGQAPG